MTTKLIAGALALALLAGCTEGDDAADELEGDTVVTGDTARRQTAPASANAALLDASGQQVGTATLTGTTLEVHTTGVAPGAHGIHVHRVGRCDAPTFESAGDHLNPANAQHGLENPAGPHMGDLPNLSVGEDGSGHLSHVTQLADSAVFDADGSAIVIHAGPDDQRTDPSGNSGGRIACGVLTR